MLQPDENDTEQLKAIFLQTKCHSCCSFLVKASYKQDLFFPASQTKKKGLFCLVGTDLFQLNYKRRKYSEAFLAAMTPTQTQRIGLPDPVAIRLQAADTKTWVVLFYSLFCCLILLCNLFVMQ